MIIALICVLWGLLNIHYLRSSIRYPMTLKISGSSQKILQPRQVGKLYAIHSAMRRGLTLQLPPRIFSEHRSAQHIFNIFIPCGQFISAIEG